MTASMPAMAAVTVALATVMVGVRLSPATRAPRLPPSAHRDTRQLAAAAAPAPRRLTVAAMLLASSVALTLLTGVTATGVIAGGAGIVAIHRRARRAASRRRALDAALPDAIELLVLTVHAGLSPTQAVIEAASRAPVPCRPAFAATTHRLQRGQSLGEALGALVDELGPAARPIADSIAAADRYGLPLAPVLDDLSHQARAARRRMAEAAARTLPVRLSFPLVVCTLPSFALLIIVPAVLGTISSLRGHAP